MALVLGLLVATAAAFALTENLKLTKSPVFRTRLVAPDQTYRNRAAALASFSPVCACRTAGVALQFSLRKADRLTLDVVDGGRHRVQRLVDAKHAHAKTNTFVWYGRTAEGSVAPDGVYQFQITLAHAHRTILLPNRIRVDTHGPRVAKATANRDTISPDGDGQSDSVKIRYRLSEPGRALLFVRGSQVVRTHSASPNGSLTWYGKVNGSRLPQGAYRLRVGAVDLAGNVTGAADGAVVLVHVRYITLAHHELADVKAGTLFGVGVQTGAASYRWQLAGRSGRSSDSVLILRAPALPGSYRLVVGEHGNSDVATLLVVPRR